MPTPRIPDFDGLEAFTNETPTHDPLQAPETKIETKPVVAPATKDKASQPAKATAEKEKKQKPKKNKVSTEKPARNARIGTTLTQEHYDKLEELKFLMRKKLRKKIQENDVIEQALDLFYAKHIKDYKL